MSGSPTRPSGVPPLRIPQPLFLANARNSAERLKLSLQFLHEDVGLNLNNTLEVCPSFVVDLYLPMSRNLHVRFSSMEQMSYSSHQ